MTSDLLLLFAIVLGVNLLPAFGPPTWSVLVIYALDTSLPTAPLVLTGASAAALGRYLLARSFRALAARLSRTSKANLEAARRMVEQSRGKTMMRLALFAVSPLPSAQLFEAAGLMRVRLTFFTLAFFAGRLVSYFIYASTAAKIRETTIGEAFSAGFREPLALALELALILMLVGLTRVDWTRWAPGPSPATGTRRGRDDGSIAE